jgi:PEGA domain
MSFRRLAAVQTGVLLAAMFANAASEKNAVRITVLDSVTRASAPDNNGVPLNCEQLTYDAYCRSTSNAPMVSTLLVQEDSQPPFRISCTIESRYSRCIPLAKGESFDAKREKHGLEVYYVDDKGKERKQLYTLVNANGKSSPAVAAVATQPLQAAPPPRQSSPATAPQAEASPVQAAAPEKIKCNFTSTPSGADITLDGKYVGSTPSQIELVTGAHVVVFAMPGFMQWKRELTVLSGSELTVNGILQKEQP